MTGPLAARSTASVPHHETVVQCPDPLILCTRSHTLLNTCPHAHLNCGVRGNKKRTRARHERLSEEKAEEMRRRSEEQQEEQRRAEETEDGGAPG